MTMKWKVVRPKAAVLCGISVSLLLIFIQMIISLLCFAGVFIFSDEALISPFRFCVASQHVVLVAFALLAVLLAVYAKDRAALWLGMACQAASGLLLLAGSVIFLLLHRSYVSWEHMTPGFYICVSVQVQLLITTMLTRVSRRRLMPEWQ